ncbi:MAG: hypothetical protein ACOC0P_02335 [Planctomycetota bacterium]
MPIDWNDLENDVDDAIGRAVAETNDELAARVSSLTRLTDAEVQAMFPTPADVKRLHKLMTIVDQATKDNNQVVQLEQNIHELAGTVVKLLDKFVAV